MSSNTKSIGVAFEDQNIIGSDLVMSGGELGYTAEASGTVTQLTDKSTAVTLNKSAGQITMNNAALANVTNVSFTLNNSIISAKDVVILNFIITLTKQFPSTFSLRKPPPRFRLPCCILQNFEMLLCI